MSTPDPPGRRPGSPRRVRVTRSRGRLWDPKAGQPEPRLLVLVLIVGAGVYQVLLALAEFWAHLPAWVSAWYGVLLSGLVVMALGWGFFLFREFGRKWYGLVEVGAAGATAAFASFAQGDRPDRLSWMLAMLASVYVAVRGFDNLKKAREEAVAAAECARTADPAPAADGGSPPESG